MLLESPLVSSFVLISTDRTKCFNNLSFNSTLQLVNGISSDLQKLLRYFGGKENVVFFRIPLLLCDLC